MACLSPGQGSVGRGAWVSTERPEHRAGGRGALALAGRSAPPAGEVVRAVGRFGALRAVVLVEGPSDQAAVEAVARRLGLDLVAAGVAVVPMGGVTNIARCLAVFGPRGLGARVAGLCDQAEAGHVQRALRRAGLAPQPGSGETPAIPGPGTQEIESSGFFVCVADLEDEVIRALGADAAQRVIEAQGEIRAFRTLQRQVAQQGRGLDAQLRRFMGSGSGRKIRYARLLVDALDFQSLPRPLVAALRHAEQASA